MLVIFFMLYMVLQAEKWGEQKLKVQLIKPFLQLFLLMNMMRSFYYIG